jgi:hypothetical protein
MPLGERPVEDTLQSMESQLTSKEGSTMPEQRTKTFHQKVLCGKIQGMVRYLTEWEKGGILYPPDDIDKKTGKTIQPVLESKHLDAQISGADALTNYYTRTSQTSRTLILQRTPSKS